MKNIKNILKKITILPVILSASMQLFGMEENPHAPYFTINAKYTSTMRHQAQQKIKNLEAHTKLLISSLEIAKSKYSQAKNRSERNRYWNKIENLNNQIIIASMEQADLKYRIDPMSF